MGQEDSMPDDSSAGESPQAPSLAGIDVAAGILALALGTAFVLNPSGHSRADSLHRGDEGSILALGAILFVLPTGALLLAAGVGLWRGRRWGRVLHYVALSWPFLVGAIIVVTWSL
jgi:uncharacterized membrane protein (DUF2068 family)